MKKLFAILVPLALLLCGMSVGAFAEGEEIPADELYAALQPVVDSPDWVVDLPAAQVLPQLTLLQIKGLITQKPGKIYER